MQIFNEKTQSLKKDKKKGQFQEIHAEIRRKFDFEDAAFNPLRAKNAPGALPQNRFLACCVCLTVCYWYYSRG